MPALKFAQSEAQTLPAAAQAAEKPYWESFYKNSGGAAKTMPSQFAAFALEEMPPGADIVELGCGNGRDALFFARYGHRVIAADAAREAVDSARERAAQEVLPAHFICSPLAQMSKKAGFILHLNAPLMLYSRFFLHSVSEGEEARFFSFCLFCLTRCGGKKRWRQSISAALLKPMILPSAPPKPVLPLITALRARVLPNMARRTRPSPALCSAPCRNKTNISGKTACRLYFCAAFCSFS